MNPLAMWAEPQNMPGSDSLIDPNVLSLVFVNGSGGLAFGAAIVMAIEVFRIPRRWWGWWFWGLMFLWAVLVLGASMYLQVPMQLYVRRWIGTTATTFIAVVVWVHLYQERRARRHVREDPRDQGNDRDDNYRSGIT